MSTPLPQSTENVKLEYNIVYPSIMSGQAGDPARVYMIQAFDINLLGYPHKLRNGLSNWAQGLKTLPPEDQNGRMLIMETSDAAALWIFLITEDVYFDLVAKELPQEQNRGAGQWKYVQIDLIGCKTNPASISHKVGDEMITVAPFSFTRAEFNINTIKAIGPGIFGPDDSQKPEVEDWQVT